MENLFAGTESLVNVNVYIKNDMILTDSRNVADHFSKRHDHVLRDIENIEKDIPNFGEMFFVGTKPDSYGREQKIYYMNRDGFTILAMGFNGKDAMEWKLKYIEAFNQMEKSWNTPEKAIANALILAHQLLEDKDRQIKEMQPKAEFFDAVAESKDAIEIGKVAKLLNYPKIGRNKLFEILRKKKILMQNNIPYQKYIDCGYFRTIEQKFNTPDGEVKISIKTLVYQRGVDYIRKVIEKTP